MPTVAEASAVYGNFMLAPRHGPEVCPTCFNLTDGHERCYSCAHGQQWLDGMAAISYSIGHEQLHYALAGYKRMPSSIAERFTRELAAVLWRWLAIHEPCVATQAGVSRFELVATVPSNDRRRDEQHPLRQVVGEVVGPTRERHERLLMRSELPAAPRAFDLGKYNPTRPLAGEAILLIDDTWTTGANAQSAAAALKRAGAGTVAAVVIGRYLNRDWGRNNTRLRSMPRPFDWDRCAVCAPEAATLPADDGTAQIGAPQRPSAIGSARDLFGALPNAGGQLTDGKTHHRDERLSHEARNPRERLDVPDHPGARCLRGEIDRAHVIAERRPGQHPVGEA